MTVLLAICANKINSYTCKFKYKYKALTQGECQWGYKRYTEQNLQKSSEDIIVDLEVIQVNFR